MFGSEIIEVAIGLAFTFFLVSNICNGIVEIIAELTKARAEHLKTGLKHLLGDKDGKIIIKDLYQHHLIDSGMTEKVGLPTYIAAENFAEALLDTLVPDDGKTFDERMAALEAKIKADIPNKRVQDALLKALSRGQHTIDDVKKKIADWFNNSMWDLSKWYRKWTKKIVVVSSVVLVIGMNADSIRIAKTLYTNPELRTAINNATENYVEKYTPPPVNNSDTLNTTVLRQQLANLESDIKEVKEIPIGWWSEDVTGQTGEWWVFKILGLLLTVGAVSLGSGFWYDFLTKWLSFNSSKKKTS